MRIQIQTQTQTQTQVWDNKQCNHFTIGLEYSCQLALYMPSHKEDNFLSLKSCWHPFSFWIKRKKEHINNQQQIFVVLAG